VIQPYEPDDGPEDLEEDTEEVDFYGDS